MQTTGETGVVFVGQTRPQSNWASSQVTQWLRDYQAKNASLKTSLLCSNMVKSQLWYEHALLTIKKGQ